VTVFCGILNTLSGDAEYVNAGHNPPYLLPSYGEDKLKTLLEEHFVLPIDSINKELPEDVNAFANGTNGSDDIALMAIVFNG